MGDERVLSVPGRFDFFAYERCELCGECLLRCRYIKLTREEAVEEKKRLIEGLPTRKVMQKCISCYACNAFCPHDCRPYELILKQWYERYRQRGLPARAAYVMPLTQPDFRVDIVKKMGAREQAMLKRWRETEPEGEFVLYPGCNLMALPHLADASYMQDLVISGEWEHCCGEMFFRAGLFDVVEKTARKLTEYYRGRQIGTMLFACPACLNMFANVLPQQFGADFNFKTGYLLTYLLEKIEAEEIKLQKKLNREVTVHDSCHGRILGEQVTESARCLLAKTGADIKEMEYNRRDGLCCGLAAGVNRFSPLDMYFAGARELWQAQKSGADELASYCGGCNLSFYMFRRLFPTRQPVRHVLEYLKAAAGEGEYCPGRKRSFHMLLNIAKNSFPKLFSTRTYRY